MAKLCFPKIHSISDLAVLAACLNIAFLSYSSQFLLHRIAPGLLSMRSTQAFNAVVITIWTSYYRTCTVDPGPRKWIEACMKKQGELQRSSAGFGTPIAIGIRWCKKCATIKLPRAHHCMKCGRCIPKMDHHCPFIKSCVSYTTLPHFLRFIFYSVLGMSILDYHLYNYLWILWEMRNMPAESGPSAWVLSHLLVLLLLNNISLFGLVVLLLRTIYSLATNTTMIESWEIERHEILVERAKESGGFLYARNGKEMRLDHQEFPYDIGIWRNICQGMGTTNIVMWFMPFVATPSMESALEYETNGFEDKDKQWPPLDPDKVPRSQYEAATFQEDWKPEVGMKVSRKYRSEAFGRQDLRRPTIDKMSKDCYKNEEELGMDGKAGWTNSEGDRLKDYGVDEEAEASADENVPLGELLRRRHKGEKAIKDGSAGYRTHQNTFMHQQVSVLGTNN